MMLDLAHAYVLPAAFSLMPANMDSTEARAMLLAIALQESRFVYRAQIYGPARGFWQFEMRGVEGVLVHDRTNHIIARVLLQLGYPHTLDVEPAHAALEHNDVLAACFARCLLWTVPEKMPARDDIENAWSIYLRAWRPGDRSRRSAWTINYQLAWNTTDSSSPQSLKA